MSSRVQPNSGFKIGAKIVDAQLAHTVCPPWQGCCTLNSQCLNDAQAEWDYRIADYQNDQILELLMDQ
jgi:hypothetical protein